MSRKTYITVCLAIVIVALVLWAHLASLSAGYGGLEPVNQIATCLQSKVACLITLPFQAGHITWTAVDFRPPYN